jgi:hypothetical protein
MKPREGKHAPNPKGFPGGGTAPEGGSSTPLVADLGPLFLPVRCASSAEPPQCGGLCCLPRSPPDFLQPAGCSSPQASSQALHARAAQPPTPPPPSGAPGLSRATRPQGRSSPRASVSGRSAIHILQVVDTKDRSAQLDPRVGYASMWSVASLQGPAERGPQHRQSPRVLRKLRARRHWHPDVVDSRASTRCLDLRHRKEPPRRSTTASRLRTGWMPRPLLAR